MFGNILEALRNKRSYCIMSLAVSLREKINAVEHQNNILSAELQRRMNAFAVDNENAETQSKLTSRIRYRNYVFLVAYSILLGVLCIQMAARATYGRPPQRWPLVRTLPLAVVLVMPFVFHFRGVPEWPFWWRGALQ